MALNGNAEIFRKRREKFLRAIGEGAVAIIPSAPVAVRSNDVDYIYRQDSDFYYLTGFVEPESVAVFAPGHPDGEFALFVPPRDKERETWTGRRAGVEGAMMEYGADKAYVIDEFERVIARYLDKAERLHYPLGHNEKMNERVLRMMKHAQAMRPRTGAGASAIFDPREILHEARLYKETFELDLMRKAAAISAQAHQRAMREARGGMMEWEVEAIIDFTFRKNGAAGPSYPSIVASAGNAAVLHYITNDRQMNTGEFLLIDAGCEYQFYASDVTRTFPIGAKFSALQKSFYELVLAAQMAAIEVIKPGVRFDDPHDAALRILVDGMREFGLVKGSTDEVIANGSYRRYYMHRTSHWLGMDVHDVGLYRQGAQSRVLEPGMMLTVEPGIYIAPDDDDAPEQYRGIGIRIEDDVLVTAEGHEVITHTTPKKVSEVEALTAA